MQQERQQNPGNSGSVSLKDLKLDHQPVPKDLAEFSIPRDKLRDLIDKAVDREFELKRADAGRSAPEIKNVTDHRSGGGLYGINGDRFFSMGREVGLSDEALTQTLERYKRQCELREQMDSRRQKMADQLLERRRSLGLPDDASADLVAAESAVRSSVDIFLSNIDRKLCQAIDYGYSTIDTDVQFDWTKFSYGKRFPDARTALKLLFAPFYLFDHKVLEQGKKPMFLQRDFTSVKDSPSLKRLFEEAKELGLKPVFQRKYNRVSVHLELPNAL